MTQERTTVKSHQTAPRYRHFKDVLADGFTIDWTNSIFIVGSHTLALVLGIWLITTAPSHWLIAATVWALLHAFIGSLSTTVYTHRLIAHNAAKNIHPAVHWFFCSFAQIFAVQGSVRRWAANHVIHHGVDRHGKHQLDPYSATWFEDTPRNFLWSHIFTFFFKHPESTEFNKAFASKNYPALVWQDTYFPYLLFFWIALLPAGLGFALGGWLGLFALFGGSMIGTILGQHNTWTVNSVTHLWGFTKGLKSSAVNNYFWLGPLGEGNHHGDHHDFPRDYRNGFGLSGWMLDPTRYVILLLNATGLVTHLNRASKQQESEIIAKRKLVKMQYKASKAQQGSVFSPETLIMFEQLEIKVHELKSEWIDAVSRFETLKAESKLLKKANVRKAEISKEIQLAKQQMIAKKEAFFIAVKSMNNQSILYT